MCLKHILIVFLFCWVVLCGKASEVGYLLHITDVHLDLQYQAGAPTQCILGNTGMGCCRNSSIPLPDAPSAGPWGSDNCDTAPQFFQATLEWIANHLDVDAIVWTGDIVDHNDVLQTWNSNRAEIAWASNVMQSLFPGTPVYPCLGNHDTWPIDQLYPGISAPEILKDVAGLWQTWLQPNSQESFSENGVYRQTFGPGQVIALNSLYLDPENLAVLYNTSADIGCQMNFLQDFLGNNMSTWILGHIPPGSSDAVPWFATTYSQVAGLSQVQAHFWGHTHHDEFRLLFDDTHTHVTGVAFIAPSLMIDGHFPAFRRYTYNKTTLALLDYEQYWLNWTQQLSSPDHFVGYFLGYSAQAAYSVPDLSPTAMLALLNRMKQNQTLVQQYFAYYGPNTTEESKGCDAVCCRGLLCDIEFVTAKEHEACLSA
jgi:sphingomyelin phosphodiesterase